MEDSTYIRRTPGVVFVYGRGVKYMSDILVLCFIWKNFLFNGSEPLNKYRYVCSNMYTPSFIPLYFDSVTNT